MADRDDWPLAREFETDGRTDLRQAVKRHGGTAYWARRCGKQLANGQDRSAYTAEDAVAEARAFIKASGSLPNVRVLRTAGHPRLATFIQTRGGGSVGAFLSAYLSEHKKP